MTDIVINGDYFWQAVLLFIVPWTFGWVIMKFTSLNDLNNSKKRGRERGLVSIIFILSIGLVILSIALLACVLMVIGDV